MKQETADEINPIAFKYLPEAAITFTGSSHNFKDSYLADELNRESIANALITTGIKQLGIIIQVHGEEIITIDKNFQQNFAKANDLAINILGNADGLYIEDYPELFKIYLDWSFGIRSADCLPILIAGKKNAALLHAGWRGIANRLIENAAAKFRESGDLEAQVVIGPSACEDDYEVGGEVIRQLENTCAVVSYKPAASGTNKYLLNLPQTALEKISRLLKVTESYLFPASTISDLRFHSYRRDGDKSGRNLSFIKIMKN